MIAKQVDPAYISLLDIGVPTETTEKYFSGLLRRNLNPDLHSEIFIFNKENKIIIHSNQSVETGQTEPRLSLNQKEIGELKINSTTTSLPFKGDDENWYLWGFNRLNESHYLAVRGSAARFNEIEGLSTLFLFIGLGGVIITIIISWLIANEITKPLNKLVDFSTEIGTGNFSAVQPENMHGEIKILSDAMDKMKKDLSENHKEREKLLAQIAHEIRNPLGGIELLTNLAKENHISDEKNKEYLDRILCEVHGLKSLITSYLNFSRPIPSQPVWIDFQKTVLELENIFKLKIREKSVTFNKDIKLNKIYFDEGHLKQILINLIANSLEAVEDNGNILLSAKEKSDRWEIILSDDGPGIPENDIKNIFNPFFTTKKDGTGLGLAISRKLSAENKADLQVKNNSKGAHFILSKEKQNEI
jgi:signal transduction histidine kinase